jgi:hypothetical protein
LSAAELIRAYGVFGPNCHKLIGRIEDLREGFLTIAAAATNDPIRCDEIYTGLTDAASFLFNTTGRLVHARWKLTGDGIHGTVGPFGATNLSDQVFRSSTRPLMEEAERVVIDAINRYLALVRVIRAVRVSPVKTILDGAGQPAPVAGAAVIPAIDVPLQTHGTHPMGAKAGGSVETSKAGESPPAKEEPLPDGPTGGGWFCWKGKAVSLDLQPKPLDILKCCWKLAYPYGDVHVSDIHANVWGDEVDADEALKLIKPKVSAINAALERVEGFRQRIRLERYSARWVEREAGPEEISTLSPK